MPIWVDVYVSSNTVAGTYSGCVYFRNAKSPIRIIYVFSQGASLLQIPIFVTVWDFVLDDMRSVKTHFSLSEDPETAFHNGTYDWCSGTQISTMRIVTVFRVWRQQSML